MAKSLRSFSTAFPLNNLIEFTETVSSNQCKFHNRLSETLDLLNCTVYRTFA